MKGFGLQCAEALCIFRCESCLAPFITRPCAQIFKALRRIVFGAPLLEAVDRQGRRGAHIQIGQSEIMPDRKKRD
jgi:hypothetical protein